MTLPSHAEAEAEQLLAKAGYAVLSAEMYSLLESIEARLAICVSVPEHEISAVFFAADSSVYGDYHQAKALAWLGGRGEGTVNRWRLRGVQPPGESHSRRRLPR